VCICPKSCVFAPNFLSLNFPLIVCICPKSCESSPNQALITLNKQTTKTTEQNHQNNRTKQNKATTMALLTRRQKFAIRSLFISGIRDEKHIMNYLAQRGWTIRIGSIEYICLINYMVKLRRRRSMQEVQRMQKERGQTSPPSSPLPSIEL